LLTDWFGRSELFQCCFKIGFELRIELLFLADRGQERLLTRFQKILKFVLEFFHTIYRHWVDELVLHRPHHRDLQFHR